MRGERGAVSFLKDSVHVGGAQVLVTTNLSFAEWVKVFGGDEKLTTALLDRLAHHATVISTQGKELPDAEALSRRRLSGRRGRVSLAGGGRPAVGGAQAGWISFRPANRISFRASEAAWRPVNCFRRSTYEVTGSDHFIRTSN